MPAATTTQRRLFLSYTSELERHADVVRRVATERGWYVDDHRDWAANGHPTVSECEQRVAACDAVLLLCGFRYGWVPSLKDGAEGFRSITRIEWDTAWQYGRPRVALLASADSRWPRSAIDTDLATRMQSFRNILDQTIRDTFDENADSVSRPAEKALAALAEAVDQGLVARPIQLAPEIYLEMFPPTMRVVSFAPGKRLRIRYRPDPGAYVMMAIFTFVFLGMIATAFAFGRWPLWIALMVAAALVATAAIEYCTVIAFDLTQKRVSIFGPTFFSRRAPPMAGAMVLTTATRRGRPCAKLSYGNIVLVQSREYADVFGASEELRPFGIALAHSLDLILKDEVS